MFSSLVTVPQTSHTRGNSHPLSPSSSALPVLGIATTGRRATRSAQDPIVFSNDPVHQVLCPSRLSGSAPPKSGNRPGPPGRDSSSYKGVFQRQHPHLQHRCWREKIGYHLCLSGRRSPQVLPLKIRLGPLWCPWAGSLAHHGSLQ